MWDETENEKKTETAVYEKTSKGIRNEFLPHPACEAGESTLSATLVLWTPSHCFFMPGVLWVGPRTRKQAVLI